MKIQKVFGFEAAHRLRGYKGPCANLHGHSYKLFIAVSDDCDMLHESGHEEGMVIDFTHLKQIIQEDILNLYDHALILENNSDDPFDQVLATLDTKKVFISGRTTAENIAIDIYHRLMNRSEFTIDSVAVFETEKNSVSYSGEYSY